MPRYSVNMQERAEEFERRIERIQNEYMAMEDRAGRAEVALVESQKNLAEANGSLKKLGDELAEAKGAVTIADKALAAKVAEMEALKNPPAPAPVPEAK